MKSEKCLSTVALAELGKIKKCLPTVAPAKVGKVSKIPALPVSGGQSPMATARRQAEVCEAILAGKSEKWKLEN